MAFCQSFSVNEGISGLWH